MCNPIKEKEFNREIYNAISTLLDSRGISKADFSLSLGYSTNAFSKMEHECRFFTLPKFFRKIDKLNVSSSTIMKEAKHHFWFFDKSGHVLSVGDTQKLRQGNKGF